MSSLLRVDDELRDALADWIANRWNAKLANITPIAPGLGTRRFYRVRVSDGSAPAEALVARVDAEEDPAKRAPSVAPEPPLEPIRQLLETSGIPVPRRYAHASELRTEFLEDVGDRSLERAAHEVDVEERRALYGRACEIVVRLQGIDAPTPPIEAFGRRLDRALFESKADRVVRWALPYWLPRPVRAEDEATVRDLYDRVAALCESAPMRLAHRDYKAANIHVVENGRLVLIDLQGAFLAPPEYDLVCLLRDAHVRLPWDEVAAHLEATRPRLPDAPSREDFDERFTLLTLTRVAKDAAHYIHAFTDAGDTRYLPLLPNARASLVHAAEKAATLDPAFEGIAALFGELREP
ncbi:MAG: phosphotransferase [Myxococcota bacterium]|jgi:hypothetical protein|nr:phosphotransferase [Myxococcota bacterium]